MNTWRPFALSKSTIASLTLSLLWGLSLWAAAPTGYEEWYPHRLTPSSPASPAGPWTAASCAFYIVHHGGQLEIDLSARRPDDDRLSRDGRRFRRSVFFQTYGADESLLDLSYHNFEKATDRRFLKTVTVPDAPAGIYQVRYAKAPGDPSAIEISTEPECSIGVMPVRTRFAGITSAYLYVPPGEQRLTVPTYASVVTLTSAAGEPLATRGPKQSSAPVMITGPTVVRVDVSYRWDGGRFNITGVPPIFCADPATARNIRGSIEVAPDGRLLAHKFQVRMWEWMHSLAPADLAIEPRSLLALEEEWVQDPRNVGLLGHSGGFNHIPRILADQNLDPSSPGYGLGTTTAWLGPAYVIDKPFNPYRREPAILNRLILQEFAHFLRLDENGTFNANHWDHYFGGDALGYRQRVFQFGYVAPHIDPALRRLWFEGASKVLNRAGMTRVTCENQTSHWLLDLWLLGEASERKLYKTMAHDFAIALERPEYNPFMETGYQQERYGPDATYQGLSASQQAIYYEYSRDEVVKQGLKRIYSLFNHTVAPEPDGNIRGASNFSHRTTGSWVQRQYNGGLRLMSDELPQAGVWYTGDRAPQSAEEAIAEIRTRLRMTVDNAYYERNMRWLSTYAYHPWLGFFHDYLFPSTGVLAGTWPALESSSFTKNANDEFLFVKRPSYYAVFYTGKTSHEWVRPSYKSNPFLDGWKLEEGILVPTTAASKKNSWRPTQGLSLLWNQTYGNAVLGKCWNAYTNQIVRADLTDGGVAWPDYWSFEHSVEATTGHLNMRWTLRGLPVAIERTVRFADEFVDVSLSVNVSKDCGTKRMVEQFPILVKDGMTVTFQDTETRWRDVAQASCQAVRMALEDGSHMQLEFNRPVAVRMGTASRLHGQTIHCLEVLLGREFKANDEITLSYRVVPRVPAVR